MGIVRIHFRILWLLVVATACGDSTSPVNPTDEAPDSVPTQGDVASALEAIPTWSTLSPPVPESGDDRMGDQTDAGAFLSESDDRYNPAAFCVATPHSLGKNPREIITLSADQGILVPGVLLQGKSHILGTLSQLQIVERAPIELVINDASATVPTRAIDTPTLGTLQSGVNSLIQDAETSGFEGSSSVVYDKVTSYSAEQAALALSFSARYLGATASGSLRSRTSGSQTTVTASFVQNAFSIRAEGPPFAEDWFTDDLTEATLSRYFANGQIGPDNPPLYVQSVTYGRIAMVNFTASESEEDIIGFFEAGYSNGIGELNADVQAEYEQMIRNASIQVVSLGGPAESGFQFAKEVLDPDNPDNVGLDGFFAEDVPLTAFVPISYVLADLRTGEVAYVGETTNHDILDCAGRAESTFEGGTEGWTGINMEAPYNPAHFNSAEFARTGTGGLLTLDGNTSTSYLRAPAKFRGDKGVYVGGELSFWTRVFCSFSGIGGIKNPYSCDGRSYGFITSPALLIEGDDSQLTLVGHFSDDAFIPTVWQQRTVSLAPGDLYVFNATAGESQSDAVPATEEQIREVLANISRLSIRSEFASGETDFVYVDDVRLDPPPVPLS